MSKYIKNEGSRHSRYPIFIIGITFFVLGGLSIYLLLYYFYHPGKTTINLSNINTIRIGRFGLINPLLEYSSGDKGQFGELSLLKEKMLEKIGESIKNGFASEVGVYFRDLQSGHWTGINETYKFFPASLLKVPLMMAYLKLAETEPEILGQRLTYDGSYDLNTLEIFKPVKAIEVNKSYTVDDLIRFMITYSDNNATAILYSHINHDLINKVYIDLGITVPAAAAAAATTSSNSGFLGAQNYSLFFRVLYNSTFLNQGMSQRALSLLSYNDFPQGIQAGVPENITVADKFGEYDLPDNTKELHDCGIVYHSQTNYLLCVMTKGSDFIKLANVIRNISILTYKSVDSSYRN